MEVRDIIIIGLLAAGAYWYSEQKKVPAPGPAPVPHVNVVTELKDKVAYALQGPDAKADAAYFASVFESTHNKLVALKATNPGVFKDRAQVEKLVENLGAVAVVGKTKGKYPGLPAVVAWQFSEPRFPKAGGELTEADWNTLLTRLDELRAAFDAVSK